MVLAIHLALHIKSRRIMRVVRQHVALDAMQNLVELCDCCTHEQAPLFAVGVVNASARGALQQAMALQLVLSRLLRLQQPFVGTAVRQRSVDC